MVSTTFTNLPSAKQARITRALLTEFSAHPLADAQVARIVQDAGIARGAFYKYFADLTDAYRYLFDKAMTTIHGAMPATPGPANADAYITLIDAFVTQADQAGYRDLIAMHYRHNEGLLGVTPTALTTPTDPTRWAMTVLYHQTVKDIVLDPTTATARLAQLRAALP